MARNSDFFEALRTILWVSQIRDPGERAQTEAQRDAALDALLKTDPNNVIEYRKAIYAHKDFWDLTLNLRGIKTADQAFVESDEFLNAADQITLNDLHKLAAEQRVRGNLYKADNDVLIGILANNPDVCRAYLAEKAELGLLKDAKGWTPNVTVLNPTTNTQVPTAPPQNKSVAILPDDAVTRIQEEASQLLLFNLIQKSNDKVALKNLRDASTQLELDAAMQALRFPPSALPPNMPNRIAHPLTSISWINNQVIFREKEVREAWAKNNFETYVENLPIDQLLAKKEALEATTWENYREGLDEPYKHDLTQPDLKASAGILGARYLQVVLSKTEANEDFLTALNGNDSDLVEAIRGFEDGGEFDYIADAIKYDAPAIRQGLFQNFIRNLDSSSANIKLLSEINSVKTAEDFIAGLRKLGVTNVDWINKDEWQDMQEWSHSKAIEMVQEQVLALPNNSVNQDVLKKINTAKTIEEFRDELKKIGIDPVDWITRADKDDIQKETRSHAFNMHLGSAKFGAAFRPQLLSAISQLPPKKQEALLQNPAQIHHLLNAKDAKAVRFYLGQDAQGVDAVVTENKRLAGFQQLHSVPIAKALANAGVTLDSQKIQALNDLIETIHDGDFESNNKYKALVDDISEKCGIPTGNPRVYAAFGLNEDGEEYLEDAKDGIVASIENQRTYNDALHQIAVNPRDPRNNELINILLRIEKNDTSSFDPALNNTQIDKINAHFKASGTLSKFLEKIGTDSDPAVKALKSGLQNELPAMLFNQLKIQSLAAPLRGTDMQAFNNARKQMNAQVDAMIETRKSFSDSFDKLKFLDDIDPVHLAAPQFIRECKNDPDGMRARFGAMAASCDITVDRLLRNQALLMAQLASLPKPISIPRGTDEYEFADRYNDVLDLREKLNEELAITNNNLKHFQKFQAKLSDPDPDKGILKAIDRAIDGKKNDYYTPSRFTTTIIKAGNTITTGPSTVNAPYAVRVRDNVPSARSPSSFLANERLGPGDKCEYAIKYVDPAGGNFTAQGKFTESHDKLANPAPSTMKDGKITKQQECTFVVEEPLKQTTAPPINKEKLMAANVEMYMSMAVAILSRFDPSNPPSKTNPIRMDGTDADAMRHLWTALVIVGEKNTKKMRFGMDAIKIESGPFNPAKERGLLGFTDESYYKKYKKEHGQIIDSKVSDAQGMAQKQTAHSDAVKHAEKGMDRYKKEVSGIRDTVTKAEKVREEEGVAPEKPVVGFKR